MKLEDIEITQSEANIVNYNRMLKHLEADNIMLSLYERKKRILENRPYSILQTTTGVKLTMNNSERKTLSDLHMLINQRIKYFCLLFKVEFYEN